MQGKSKEKRLAIASLRCESFDEREQTFLDVEKCETNEKFQRDSPFFFLEKGRRRKRRRRRRRTGTCLFAGRNTRKKSGFQRKK